MAEDKAKKPEAGLESYLEPPTPKPVDKEKSVFSGLRVSLMPTDLAGSATMDPRRAVAVLAVVLAVESLLIGMAYLALMKVSNDRAQAVESLKSELATLQSQTPALEKKAAKAVQFSAQYEANQISLDQHIYWTRFLPELEKFILPSIQCTSFSGDIITGTVNMDCHGRNYRDVAEQIVYMRTNPLVTDLRTSAASVDVDKDGSLLRSTFSMNLKFKPSAWKAVESGKMPSAAPSPTSVETSPSAPTIIKQGQPPVQLEPLTPATTTASGAVTTP
jgi:hypothetical protein